MKYTQLPDEGAYITIYTRTGRSVTGWVDGGHEWAVKDELICLALGPKGDPRELETGECLWQYIVLDEIVGFDWDCRP